MNKIRYLNPPVSQDLLEKMVFIGGPRQVGKTTLARQIISEKKSYLNWDHFKKGGDSLFGRYHYFRLHPFSLRELDKKPNSNDVDLLLNLGGFPEPVLRGSKKNYRRWSLERLNRVVYTDINDLENIREMSSIEVLVHSLNERIASILSIESLRQDLRVSHNTVSRWLDILQALYVCFRISPLTGSKIRSVKKEKKLYFWDWAQVSHPGSRFENMVASQLLKYCHFIEDTEGYKMDLQYLRDRDGREIDFVVVKEQKPLFAVECKTSEGILSKNIKYFKERTNIPEFYQVHLGKRDYGSPELGGRCLPFWKFCQIKQMP